MTKTTEIIWFILFIPAWITYIFACFIINILAFPMIAFIASQTNETMKDWYNELNEYLFSIIFTDDEQI